MTDQVDAALALLAERSPEPGADVGLILGSGLGGLADSIEGPAAVPYADLPGFPRSTVEGHAGRLVIGRLGGARVACLQGRFHLYEGHNPGVVRLPVRLLKALGCTVLVVTNAAGSLRAEAPAGSVMLITDHIDMLPGNPLVGANDPRFGPRFPAMDQAYDRDLADRLRSAATACGVTLHEGVYLATLGPSFETPAEIRAFRALGADAVGMSTVPEVIVARHCGLRVAALSVLTNLGAGMSDVEHGHEQTLHYAGLAARDMERLIVSFLEDIGDGQ